MHHGPTVDFPLDNDTVDPVFYPYGTSPNLPIASINFYDHSAHQHSVTGTVANPAPAPPFWGGTVDSTGSGIDTNNDSIDVTDQNGLTTHNHITIR
jgi:hypothetical protein